MAKQKLGPNQRKWLKALESGKFKQTRVGALRTTNGGFCCLGVACELFKTKATKVDKFDTRFAYDTLDKTAPNFVVSALALYNDIGSDAEGKTFLTAKNDKGSSFKQIAALIRKDPSVYFKRTQ